MTELGDDIPIGPTNSTGSSQPGWIVIPKWDVFQHRDSWRARVPTWICEYTEQTSHDDYLRLTLAQRGLLHGLRLEYARSRAQLSASTSTLARRLGVRQILQRDIDALVQAGFIELSASKPASDDAGITASRPASLEERTRHKPSSRSNSRNADTYDPTHWNWREHTPYHCRFCRLPQRDEHEMADHIENCHWMDTRDEKLRLAKAEAQEGAA